MNKIKISELEFKNSKTYHNGIEVDLSEDYSNELLDLEDDKLEYLQLNVEEFTKNADVNHMNQILWVRMLSSLMKLHVIEDMTFIQEADDAYYFESHDSIRNMIQLEVDHYNPYKMKYDSKNLTKEEDGSYSLNSITCIESNNRTSNFFRHFLMLHNSDGNVLQVGFTDESQAINQFTQHSYLKIPRIDNDTPAFDYLDTLVEDDGLGYIGAFIKQMVFLLRDWNDCRTADEIKRILKLRLDNNLYSYNDPTLDLVELKAIKLKKPSLLFDYLMKSDDDVDKQRGLIKLGFNLIE